MDAPELLRLAPGRGVPNNALPVLLHRRVVPADARPADYEALFAGHGWSNAWTDGVYSYHHFHSTAHEALGIVRGRAVLRLGGETGRDVAVAAGDVVVLPAGTGHRRIHESEGFLVVGAYPEGRDWDLLRADSVTDEDLRRAEANIKALPLPARDPVTGEPMALIWNA